VALRELILASSSTYRKTLLSRLGLEFECIGPATDESELPGELPKTLARRLAESKARAIHAPSAIIIGSDQVPTLAGEILRKPGNHATAMTQLLACQGKTVDFYTAVFVIDCATGRTWGHVDETRVSFSRLGRSAINRYLEIEQPYDCAGGFKAEGLGISLFTSIAANDPTALIGLPLIALTNMLREAGIDPLHRSGDDSARDEPTKP
jgi:septum formation protein